MTARDDIADAKLKEAIFKLEHGDGIFAYAIYRPVAYGIMKLLKNRRMNPNLITIFAMTLYVLAGLILIIQFSPRKVIAQVPIFSEALCSLQKMLQFKYASNLDVGSMLFLILYNLALVVDCMDGSVARYLNRISELGRALDTFSDSFGHVVVMIGLILMLPSHAIPISTFFLVYYSLCLLHLSYKFEQLKVKKTLGYEVRPLFKLGKFKILVGTLDYFVMSVNGIFIVQILGLNISLYLLLVDLFWFLLLIGYMIGLVIGIKPAG